MTTKSKGRERRIELKSVVVVVVVAAAAADNDAPSGYAQKHVQVFMIWRLF